MDKKRPQTPVEKAVWSLAEILKNSFHLLENQAFNLAKEVTNLPRLMNLNLRMLAATLVLSQQIQGLESVLLTNPLAFNQIPTSNIEDVINRAYPASRRGKTKLPKLKVDLFRYCIYWVNYLQLQRLKNQTAVVVDQEQPVEDFPEELLDLPTPAEDLIEDLPLVEDEDEDEI